MRHVLFPVKKKMTSSKRRNNRYENKKFWNYLLH